VSRPPTAVPANSKPSRSLHDLLLRLDRATEILEGLDELGVECREELQEMMEQLEREIDDTK